ncbi:unnamed protein product [Echinostoma caproni]|uniref:Arp2/3 complex 34 kDa subunit n=1 Tax=Echinostoma caproni TaxID=27848 RepID=A0A183BAD9_9TREM|nr:unnamed protein product [Echinostoma caproni]
MILLDVYNRSVEELLLNRFEKAKEEPDAKVRMNYTLPDFDGVVYHVCDSGPDKKRILVSIFLKFFDELKQHGALEYLRKVYGDLLADEPKAGQSVTLNIDLDKLEDDYAPLARKCAMLKRNCMASVFVKFFDLQPTLEPKAAVERAVIHYRNDETL